MATKPVTNGTTLIAVLNGYGRRYTQVRNAVIAHLLTTDVKQSVIVKESKVDKGDVSRIASIVAELGKRTKAYKSIQALDLSAISAHADNPTSAVILAAQAIGATLVRVKVSTGTRAASTPTETPDLEAQLWDYVLEDPETRYPLFVAFAARLEAEVAGLAAAADAEAQDSPADIAA